MTPRSRRLVAALGLVVALLFVGHWSVAFITERWWAATISPEAARFVTTWRLLGLSLDAGAIVVASAWFILQALLVARAITSVQVAHRLGNIQVREAVPTRLLLGGAVASGVLLGLIAGTGADAWRETIAFAWRGARYGVTDPLRQLDIGALVASLPAWDLLHGFAVLLVLLGLAFCVALYAGIGALRRDGRAVQVHPDARLHLGALLSLLALVVAAGYLLTPYHLAADTLPTPGAGSLEAQWHAAQFMAGVAAATAALSVAWALRGRNAVLAAGWAVLAVGAVVARYVVPGLAVEAPAPGRMAAVRHFDSLAWGIRNAPPTVPADSVPAVTALWDEPMLARLVERGGGRYEAATPSRLTMPDGRRGAGWLVAASAPGDSNGVEVLAVIDGMTGGGGTTLMLGGATGPAASQLIWRTVADARSRPGAPAWRSAAGAVDARTPLRRLLLAWARQAPGMLHSQPDGAVDWHLDPVDRAEAILPMFSWSPADLLLIDGRLTWLVQGMLVYDAFPVATRGTWRGADVGGVVPAVLGVVDAASGGTRFYLDPAADSGAAAWARVIGPTVASAAALPPDVRAALRYPVEWLTAQQPVLRSPAWNAGHPPSVAGPADAIAPVWEPGDIPAQQVAVGTTGGGPLTRIVDAYRVGGRPQLRVVDVDDTPPADPGAAVRLLWSRATAVMHLRDSATAAGDTVWSRSTRWFAGRDMAAWQPVFTLPRTGSPALLWIATAIGDRAGGGRTPADAWRTVGEADGNPVAAGPTEASRLAQSRQWLARADSALRRGDMTAFGRAFEELRRTLLARP